MAFFASMCRLVFFSVRNARVIKNRPSRGGFFFLKLHADCVSERSGGTRTLFQILFRDYAKIGPGAVEFPSGEFEHRTGRTTG